MKKQESKPQVIDAIDRAMAILECISKHRSELGITELSRELGMHKSTVFRLLTSLEAWGVVDKDEKTQRYNLGPKILYLAAAYLSSVDIRDKAKSSMEKLRARTKETVSLFTPVGERCVCIDRLESPLDLRTVVNIGDQVPLRTCSSGKVLLAFMPEHLRNGLLSVAPGGSPSQPADVDPEIEEGLLALIRERGYAISHREPVPQVSAVSAPVFNASGEVIAALTLSGPTVRFGPEHATQHAKVVKQAAVEISMQMGYGMHLDLAAH